MLKHPGKNCPRVLVAELRARLLSVQEAQGNTLQLPASMGHRAQAADRKPPHTRPTCLQGQGLLTHFTRPSCMQVTANISVNLPGADW